MLCYSMKSNVEYSHHLINFVWKKEKKLYLRDYVCVELKSETEGLAMNSNGRESEEAIDLALHRNIFGIRQSDS